MKKKKCFTNCSTEMLREESLKKRGKSSNATVKARKAQEVLYEQSHWGPRTYKIKENGFVDLDYNDIYYEGYNN